MSPINVTIFSDYFKAKYVNFIIVYCQEPITRSLQLP